MQKKYASFPGRMLIIGFGAVGQGSLPLILRHIDMQPEQIKIVTAAKFGNEVAAAYGVEFRIEPLTKLVGAYTDWTPLAGRSSLYPDDIDASDPWQFRNFRVG